MQGADALPFRRIGFEISGRGGGAGLAHMRQPGGVGLAQIRIGQGRQRGPKFRALAPVGGAIENPASFLEALQQARLAEQLEVPGDTGLRLPDDFDQLTDREFRLPEQQQQTQAGGISRRAQHGH